MPADDHRISLPDALTLVARARDAHLLPVHGWSIDADIIREIIDQPRTGMLRCYLGVTDAGAPTLVFLAVDQSGNDNHTGTLAEYVLPCPPVCDTTSPFVAAG